MKAGELYFQFNITDEQKQYTDKLVAYAEANHTVTDIFANDPEGKERQREFRTTGTLGEVVFADAFNLPRPTKSFGAIDGQDYGKDFVLNFKGKQFSIDVKSMRRTWNSFREHYVFNISYYQVNKDISLTDYYYCISIHEDENKNLIASFVGRVSKIKVQEKGELFKKGAKRDRDNGSFFTFPRDTYEIKFEHIDAPVLNDKIKSFAGFKIGKMLPPFKKTESCAENC